MAVGHREELTIFSEPIFNPLKQHIRRPFCPHLLLLTSPCFGVHGWEVRQTIFQACFQSVPVIPSNLGLKILE